MSDEERDWRIKYREVLSRLGSEEARAHKLENVLRLIVGRLCLAAQGRDARLDRELARVASAMRKHSEAEPLEELLTPLSQAVAVLDVGTTAPAEQMNHDTVALPLLDRLALLPELHEVVLELRSRPSDTLAVHDLIDLLERVAQLAREQRAQVQRERFELEDLVQQMTARLDEIETHLAGELAERNTVQDDTAKLELLVRGEVDELRVDVQRAVDLAELRRELAVRLDSIAAHVKDFRGREETRTGTYRERAQRMRTRISVLERESRNLHHSLQEGQRLAMIDALTGIPNRAAYDDRIEREFKRWKRFGRKVSILAWDIDRFKSINDAYGHKAGDKVLRVVGQQLMRHVRDTDFVARYGGEEFVMLLVGSSPEEAQEVAEKVRGEIAELGFHFHEQRVQVTVSCGITAFAEDDGPDSVFDRADKALYRAKKAGRNCCVVE